MPSARDHHHETSSTANNNQEGAQEVAMVLPGVALIGGDNQQNTATKPVTTIAGAAAVAASTAAAARVPPSLVSTSSGTSAASSRTAPRRPVAPRTVAGSSHLQAVNDSIRANLTANYAATGTTGSRNLEQSRSPSGTSSTGCRNAEASSLLQNLVTQTQRTQRLAQAQATQARQLLGGNLSHRRASDLQTLVALAAQGNPGGQESPSLSTGGAVSTPNTAANHALLQSVLGLGQQHRVAQAPSTAALLEAARNNFALQQFQHRQTASAALLRGQLSGLLAQSSIANQRQLRDVAALLLQRQNLPSASFTTGRNDLGGLAQLQALMGQVERNAGPASAMSPSRRRQQPGNPPGSF